MNIEPDEKWHHVVVAFDGSDHGSLYLDGQLSTVSSGKSEDGQAINFDGCGNEIEMNRSSVAIWLPPDRTWLGRMCDRIVRFFSVGK